VVSSSFILTGAFGKSLDRTWFHLRLFLTGAFVNAMNELTHRHSDRVIFVNVMSKFSQRQSDRVIFVNVMSKFSQGSQIE